MNTNTYKLLARIPALDFSQTFALEKGRRYLVGSATMEPGMLVITRDRSMSRRQAWLEVVEDTLRVERHPRASQKLNGDDTINCLSLQSGESFTVGVTILQFIAASDASMAPHDQIREPLAQAAMEATFTLSAREFSAGLRDQGVRSFWEVIMEMPALMQQNNTTAGFLLALCQALHSHVSSLQVTAWRVIETQDLPELLPLHHSALGSDAKEVPATVVPSRHLVKQAFETGDDTAVVSVWSRHRAKHAELSLLSSGAAWAMCVPLKLSAREQFALYATSAEVRSGTEPREAQQFLAALGAMAKQHLLAAQAKERWGQIGQFFSPALRTILLGDAARVQEELKPAEHEATICFFDLRGSSRLAENVYRHDRDKSTVTEYFARLEKILGEAADMVFQTGGIVIDFQGDAILACWGVPQRQEAAASVRLASLASRRIVELMIEHEWPLGDANLRCGIGITNGKVLAGLFAAQSGGQALLSKYTVMGPPANQAARLEGLTKKFGVPILIDGGVAAALAAEAILIRRIAAARPTGMNQIVQIYELVLPRELGGTGVSEDGVRAYDSALGLFEQGEFEAAAEAMRFVTRDPIELFLSEQITAMRRHRAPPGWDGVINLVSK